MPTEDRVLSNVKSLCYTPGPMLGTFSHQSYSTLQDKDYYPYLAEGETGSERFSGLSKTAQLLGEELQFKYLSNFFIFNFKYCLCSTSLIPMMIFMQWTLC